MKDITVLGIHFWFDAGAAIIKNGRVLAAINEERLRNIKHYTGYPLESIKEVLKISKIHPSEIDAIAIEGITTGPFPKAWQQYPGFSDMFFQWSWINKNSHGISLLNSYNNNFSKISKIKNLLKQLEIPLKKIIFVEHHLAHAASAYYLSPWNLDEKVLVFTSDGDGDGFSNTVNIAHKGEIELVKDSETPYFDSLGKALFAQISSLLGMKGGEHAGKVMGLAPYGKSELCIDQIKQIIRINRNNNLQFENTMGIAYRDLQIRIRELLIGNRFDNIAAATQQWFEELIVDWVKNAIKKTGIHKIACSGGNFQNVKANQKILALEEVDDAFFCPAAGDDGLAVGTALQVYFRLAFENGSKPEKIPLVGSYFGSSFSDEDIEKSLKKNDLLGKAEKYDDIDGIVGELLLKDSNIVARFSGRTEWGPRALGNRSILANPSEFSITRKINQAVKKRDFWMPFAPSILESRMPDYVINPKNSPYMIISFDTTEKRNEMSGAIHPYDLTCRPQTVSSEYNPGYEKVLKSFEAKAGIGSILNTSLNIHGFPLGNNPEFAIETFMNSSIDFLAIGSYLIKKI